MRKRCVTAWCCAILATCTLMCQELWATDKTAGKNSTTSVTVQLARVTAAPASLQTRVVGTIQAVNRATIAAKITGIIEEMPVVLGSRVSKGDLLVRIGAGEIEARLSQARAQLDQAARNLEREQNLLQKKAATAETVKAMKDTRNIAEAAFREAQAMQSDTRIMAPFDGLITAKPANVGDLASQGAPLIQIEDIEHLQVVTAIPEAQALKITSGDRLPVSIPAADLTMEGMVAEIAPAVDPLSHTAPVKLDLPASPLLRPGQFARISLPGGGTTEALFIPESAILPFGQMERVFVVRDGRAQLRLVRSGSRHDGMIEILSGLNAGEQVVSASSALLVDNQPVTVQQ